MRGEEAEEKRRGGEEGRRGPGGEELEFGYKLSSNVLRH